MTAAFRFFVALAFAAISLGLFLRAQASIFLAFGMSMSSALAASFVFSLACGFFFSFVLMRDAGTERTNAPPRIAGPFALKS